jgi:hypothetical protein
MIQCTCLLRVSRPGHYDCSFPEPAYLTPLLSLSSQRTTRRMDKAPNGIWSSCPASVAFIAWILSLTSSCLCTFIIRKVTFQGQDGDRLDGSAGLLLRNQGIGFWGWEGDEGTCFSYDISGNSPSFDAAFNTASAFTTITDALGGLVMVCLMLGTVFPIVPKSYEYLGYASLLMSAFDGTTLAIMGSNVCSPGFFQYGLDIEQGQETPVLEEISKTSCGLGLGSVLAVIACILWLATAFCILRTPLASRKREPGAYRGLHKEGGDEDDEKAHHSGDNDDEAHQLYRERQEENEQRYRALMGEDEQSVDEEGQPGFQSVRVSDRLSRVKEEESGDEVSGHASLRASGTNREQEGETEFQDEHDEDQHSETRSQYSSDRDQEPVRPQGAQSPDMNENSGPSSRRSSSHYSDVDEGEDGKSRASSEIV